MGGNSYTSSDHKCQKGRVLCEKQRGHTGKKETGGKNWVSPHLVGKDWDFPHTGIKALLLGLDP